MNFKVIYITKSAWKGGHPKAQTLQTADHEDCADCAVEILFVSYFFWVKSKITLSCLLMFVFCEIKISLQKRKR